MVERADDGVIQRRAAAGIDAFERFLQFLRIVGEIAIEIEVVVVIEIHDKDFILRIAGLHESQRRGVHLGALLAHAAAVVDHQAHGDGNIFASKN